MNWNTFFGSEGKKERREQLRSVAYELEMDFTEKDEFRMIALLRDFNLFRKGGSRCIKNILQKTTGLLEEKVAIMDYQYTIRANNSSRTFYQTVFFIQSKQLALPHLLLKPENFFHKVGAWLGMQDIDFAEQPEFSKKFLLQGEDEHRIRQTVREEVMRFFLVEKEWCMESVGYFLIFYREKTLVAPGHIKILYQKGMKLCEHLKTVEW